MPEYPGQTIYPETGYPLPPPPSPTPPPPTTGLTEGETKTDEYGTWTVINGVWVLTNPTMELPEAPAEAPAAGYQCPYCTQDFPTADALATHIVACPLNPALMGGGEEGAPYTPAPPGEMGPTPDWGQVDYPVGSPEWWEMVGGARPGYMSALGLLGKEYQSPFQQYQAGMFDPLQTMWQMASPMAMMGYPSMDPGTGMFSQWAPQYAQDPFSMYGMARGMLGNVMGMTPEQRGTLGMGGGAGSFADILGMGLRSQLGPGASWLAGRVPQLQQQWMAQDPLSQAGSFIDYIREKYNLGQWL